MKWGPPFVFFMAVVQIDTMKRFYCPQKDVSLVPWDSLSCSLCTPQFVLQSAFFRLLIISPPINGFWAAGAFSCVRCSHAFRHRVSGSWG